MNPTVKKLLPHIASFFLLMALSFITFKPYVFDGKVLQQSDNIQALGMQAEVRKVKDETGDFPLWTNSMFSGMPTYQILYKTKSLIKNVFYGLLMGNDMRPPHTAFFLIMIGFYILMLTLGVDWRIGLLGAAAFGLTTYYYDLLEAGHSTKIIAIAYMAPIVAGVLLAFRGKYLIGGALTAFFLALQVYANHLQITYYLILCLGIFAIIKLVDAVRNQTLPQFGKAVGVLVLAGLLGVATSAGRLWTTYEYSQETIRGQSELTKANVESSGSKVGEDGLSKSYAFGWSYGKMESLNLIIPNFKGFSSSESFANDADSESLKAIRRLAQSQEEAQQLARMSAKYWGAQPFTGGPAYMGIVLVFLFFLGAYLIKKPMKWWLVGSAAFTIMLAWGKFFPILNYTMFDYFPMFNKFRAVTMAMGLTSLFIVILGMLGLQEFLNKNVTKEAKEKALKLAGATMGGLLLFALIASFSMDYLPDNERLVSALPDTLKDALAIDRAEMLRSDIFRGFIFVALTFGFCWFYAKKNFAPSILIAAIAILTFADQIGIKSRILSWDDYATKQQVANITEPTSADKAIMADPDLHFRVGDFSRGIDANGFTSYHHKSISGYHAAKLMRYQEIIEEYLSNPGQNIHILGMLNTKYIMGGGGQPSQNPQALGNAWFVKEFEIVESPDAEFKGLANLKPADKALISKDYAGDLANFNLKFDSSATIRLTSYHPDELVYQYTANSDQLAVFSEIYYPPSKGWKLLLDGQPYEDFTKANFLLRAAKLPAGNHELKMVFQPTAYYTGETISLIASILVIVGFLGSLFLYFKNNGIPSTSNLPEAEKAEVKREARKPREKRKKKR